MIAMIIMMIRHKDNSHAPNVLAKSAVCLFIRMKEDIFQQNTERQNAEMDNWEKMLENTKI